MKPINNWNNVKPATMGERQQLPADGYVCKIKQAKVEQKQRQDQTTYEMLCIAFDIYEGEYAGYFDEQFRESTYADKKWKGVIRQMIPTDDGSEKDERIKSFFKGAITAIEESNPGYHFNFDERTLSEKLVGIIFREEEYEYQGKNGMTVKPFIMCDSHKIANGEYSIPKPKLLNKEQTSVAPYAAPQTYSDPYFSAPTPSIYPPAPPANFAPLPSDEDIPF